MPAATTAHGMHSGGFLRPNAYTKHSPQNSYPQRPHWSSAASNKCLSQRPCISPLLQRSDSRSLPPCVRHLPSDT
jgi:hypothetical protein